jgi:hypothetical protein
MRLAAEDFRQMAAVLLLVAVVDMVLLLLLAIVAAKGGGIIPLEELLQVCKVRFESVGKENSLLTST